MVLLESRAAPWSRCRRRSRGALGELDGDVSRSHVCVLPVAVRLGKPERADPRFLPVLEHDDQAAHADVQKHHRVRSRRSLFRFAKVFATKTILQLATYLDRLSKLVRFLEVETGAFRDSLLRLCRAHQYGGRFQSVLNGRAPARSAQ